MIFPNQGSVLFVTDIWVRSDEPQADLYSFMINYLIGMGQLEILKQHRTDLSPKLGQLKLSQKSLEMQAPALKDLILSEEEDLSLDMNIKKTLASGQKDHTTESSVWGNAEETAGVSENTELLAAIESGAIVSNCVNRYHVMAPTTSKSEMLIHTSEAAGHKCWKFDFRRCERNGGLLYLNERVMKEQKRVLMSMLKRIGSNLLRGKSIMNISMPVEIFETKSFLQRISRGFGYAPQFMSKAAQTKDIAEQLKWSLALILTKFAMSCQLGKLVCAPPRAPQSTRATHPQTLTAHTRAHAQALTLAATRTAHTRTHAQALTAHTHTRAHKLYRKTLQPGSGRNIPGQNKRRPDLPGDDIAPSASGAILDGLEGIPDLRHGRAGGIPLCQQPVWGGEGLDRGRVLQHKEEVLYPDLALHAPGHCHR